MAFTGLPLAHQITISMVGKAAWRDDVNVMRLWRSVTYEELHLYAYDSVAPARSAPGRYLNF